MTDKLKQLTNLASLAKETSSSARQKLLHEVTDLFMDEPDTLNEQELAFFGDIMLKLARDMEAKVRAVLSDSLADASVAPRELVDELANDDIEVAHPILTRSSALSEPDLLSIVARHSQEHLLAISKRETVSERVADSLAEKGDDRVLGSLAGNEGAELSESTMATMIGRAVDKQAVGGQLVARTDVSRDLAENLFQNVTAAVREKLLADATGVDAATIDDAIAQTHDELAQNSDESDQEYARRFIVRKSKLNQLDNKLVTSFVENREIWKFVAGLAELTGIEFDAARQSIFDPSGQKMAVLCKAIDLDVVVFKDVIEFTDFKRSRSAQDAFTLSGVYGGMSVDSAQRALRFLRLRQKTAQNVAG
jgi:uncharacterized protein (DUF2336 family)